MLFSLNSAPLLVTTDLVKQAQLRILLRKEGIPHQIKMNRYSNDGGCEGLQGPTVDYSHEYTIYVRKRDLAKAKSLYAAHFAG